MAVRTVSVHPPSVQRETKAVALVLVQIAIASAIAIHASRPSKANPAAGLQADEIAFTKLDADEQRLYRNALDGILELEDARNATGSWPAIETLARRGVLPFAEDPIDRYGYRWTMVSDKLVTNYVGIPAAADRATLVIAVVEPEPGTAEVVDVDETHHKLADGTLFHVGIYRGALREVPAVPLSQFSFGDGWRRIAVGAPR